MQPINSPPILHNPSATLQQQSPNTSSHQPRHRRRRNEHPRARGRDRAVGRVGGGAAVAVAVAVAETVVAAAGTASTRDAAGRASVSGAAAGGAADAEVRGADSGCLGGGLLVGVQRAGRVCGGAAGVLVSRHKQEWLGGKGGAHFSLMTMTMPFSQWRPCTQYSHTGLVELIWTV